MAKSTAPLSYHSTIGNLYVTPVFTYSIEVYIIYKKRIELLFSSFKYSLKPLKITNPVKYERHKGYVLVSSIEWYGAPKRFLEKNGFTPLDIEQYKLDIKEKRKHGKVRNR